MVSAVLRALEDDGTTCPPRTVTIQDTCPDTWCARPIHVTTLEGDDIWCTSAELEAEATPDA